MSDPSHVKQSLRDRKLAQARRSPAPLPAEGVALTVLVADVEPAIRWLTAPAVLEEAPRVERRRPSAPIVLCPAWEVLS